MLFCREVPKKLLQEQGSRPPAYSPLPTAHDPNIVGDSPPEGSSVRNPPNAVSGKDTHTHTDLHFYLVRTFIMHSPAPNLNSNLPEP